MGLWTGRHCGRAWRRSSSDMNRYGQPFGCRRGNRSKYSTSAAFALPLVDLHDLPPDQQEANVQPRAEEAERPFDLGADLMLRAALLRGRGRTCPDTDAASYRGRRLVDTSALAGIERRMPRLLRNGTRR